MVISAVVKLTFTTLKPARVLKNYISISWSVTFIYLLKVVCLTDIINEIILQWYSLYLS